jgi:choline dehydrogenase-like flavoprotein
VCDAMVVGARCAGSPTAMLLARKGYRVLLVDRATFPSDTLSTHFIRRPVSLSSSIGVSWSGAPPRDVRRSAGSGWIGATSALMLLAKSSSQRGGL